MAFSAAFIWAFYCNITPKMSNGKNAIVLFFAATAITLWIQYAFSSESGMTFTLSSVSTLLISGVVHGSGLCTVESSYHWRKYGASCDLLLLYASIFDDLLFILFIGCSRRFILARRGISNDRVTCVLLGHQRKSQKHEKCSGLK